MLSRRLAAQDAGELCMCAGGRSVAWCSLALLVQKYLLTGTKVRTLTPEEQLCWGGGRM